MNAQGKQHKLQYLASRISSMTDMEVGLYAASMLDLWAAHAIPSVAMPMAYAILRYYPERTEGFIELMKAMLVFHLHHWHERYARIPTHQKIIEISKLEEVLLPYLDVDWVALVPAQDRWFHLLQQFRRDPEGGVDLRSFALDSESVHRSSTQTMMDINLTLLESFPVESKNSLDEFLTVLESKEAKALPIFHILDKDYDSLEISLTKGIVRYRDAFDHVWAFIRRSPHKETLVNRLCEEIEDGQNVCANGKLCRLMNVLEGFHEGLCSPVSPMELFQDKIALVATKNISQTEKQMEVGMLFEEFNVPMEERSAWMDVLL